MVSFRVVVSAWMLMSAEAVGKPMFTYSGLRITKFRSRSD